MYVLLNHLSSTNGNSEMIRVDEFKILNVFDSDTTL